MVVGDFFYLFLFSLGCFCDAQYGSYGETTVCSESVITVTGLDVLCDTPGTFYYGSGGYRNSDSCQVGDKAKLAVYFDIEVDDLDDVAVTVSCSSPSEADKVVLYQGAELCYIDSLKSLNGTVCPSAGSYVIQNTFYYNAANDDFMYEDDGSQALIPTITVGFASADVEDDVYDLGGANTNKCAGDSEQATLDKYSGSGQTSPFAKFWSNFGILLGTVCLVALFAFVTYRRTSSTSSQHAYADPMLQDELDQKARLVGQNKDII